MTNSKETSLQKVQNIGILTRIVNFLKKLIWKNNINFITTNNGNSFNNNVESNDFLKRIKYTEDPDKAKLLKIQDDLERKGINKENVIQLTKDLSELQKQKLESLYKEQIENYKLSINNSKNKILKIRKQLNSDIYNLKWNKTKASVYLKINNLLFS